jgi:ATPase subunit of ABC transporter with duplicated ATPase domains
MSALSSGQKNKVFMAGLLLRDPDVLLLDEPTNNLDLESLAWLEDFLAHSKCACVIVSHDRLFLDRLVRRVLEIDARTRTLSVVNGRYSDYLERARLERERQMADYEAQQDEIKRLTQSARDKREKAERGAKNNPTDNDKYLAAFKRERSQKSAQTARIIESRIEKMDLVEKPFEKEAFRINIQPTKAGGNRDIELRNVIAGYNESTFRIGPISLHMHFGDRIVIIGPNGSGKSTLLKTMSGKLPTLAGEVSVGGGLTIGDFMQEHENLPREEPIKKYLVENGPMTEQEAYALGAKYGFKKTMDSRIEALSPGGRARLLFALFSARNSNVLVLDEPTNHLDLEALSALEESVESYPGTIILVSHDRYFLKKFRSTDVYRLDEGKLIPEKSVEDYLARIAGSIPA